MTFDVFSWAALVGVTALTRAFYTLMVKRRLETCLV